MHDIVAFAAVTAMRLGEITRIRWSDLNRQDKTVIIRDRKHPREKIGNDVTIPLLGESYDIASRQPQSDDDDRIFPFNGESVSTAFTRACKKLAILDLTFHDLRHEGVSRLFEQGYGIEQVALVSGHRDWKMLARYTQIKAKDLHKADVQPMPATMIPAANDSQQSRRRKED
jgi:integrase